MDPSATNSSVPPQIPVRLQRYEESPPRQARPFWLHPGSGGLILGVDWFFFGADAVTFGLTLFVTSFLAFGITAAGVFWIQRTKARDSVPAAAAKALFGGFVAGLPTSIAGTLLGTTVLILSGLSRWNRRVK